MNCQNLQQNEAVNLNFDKLSYNEQGAPDIRGIITYDNYQVVVANGSETVSEIAKRLELDPQKFSLFNGLVASYRPREGELLALNEYLEPIKKEATRLWSQKEAKNVLNKASERNNTAVSSKGFAKHKVESGETIYSIARLYKVSVTSLAKLNKLDAEFTIYVGQNLVVPIPLKKTKPTKKVENASKKEFTAKQKNNSTNIATENKKSTSDRVFIKPVKGEIVSKYNPNSEKKKNQGIDIQVSTGSPVVAAATGTVALITDSTEKFGKIILIRHPNNLISIYGRVTDVLVKKNQLVKQGEKIGLILTDTDNPRNGSILHFEIRDGTKSVNPEDYFE